MDALKLINDNADTLQSIATLVWINTGDAAMMEKITAVKLGCPAWIKQYDTSHISSNIPHNHPADPTKAGKLKASVKVKNLAAASTFRPAGQIVKEALRELADVHQHIRAKPVNLLRTANRHRQANRPADPKPDELDFVINRDFLPSEDFIIEDLSFEGARHVLFDTPDQLQHLQRARRWFIDGTFKVVSRPFYQLMSIHAFVKKDDDIKQVPLLFVLMSRRQKRDYVAVFEALLKKFEPEQPNVEWFMLDFEAAAWQAVRQVFQRTLIRGCVFHWTQRI